MRDYSTELYFSDVFGVRESDLDEYGAFNISVVTDLPLFIDPFLLFNSDKPEYQKLHSEIIEYLRFLRRKSEARAVTSSLIDAWYCFAEVKQNWFGFCEQGNRGRGLGRDFARALDANLVDVFRDFGSERVTRGSHLEKLCLIRSGIGRDMISDFTTNLIMDFLLRFTEGFTRRYVREDLRQLHSVPRAIFNYVLQRWMPKTYELPVFDGDYVILTPRDILTKDDTWISHSDMIRRFHEIPDAVDDQQLRAQINNYLQLALSPYGKPTRKDYERAALATLSRFPLLIDHYIKLKEDTGDQATASSAAKVLESHRLYVEQFRQLIALLSEHTPFYGIADTTRQETKRKIEFFKDVVENKGGHRLFYVNGVPIRREDDLHILFRLVWHGTFSDVSREVNDGRGPADFKISRGSGDKTIVEFKLGSNPQLRRNLQKQAEEYQKASDAATSFKVIVFFSEAEQAKVFNTLQDLSMLSSSEVVLIDARMDNKPSASKA